MKAQGRFTHDVITLTHSGGKQSLRNVQILIWTGRYACLLTSLFRPEGPIANALIFDESTGAFMHETSFFLRFKRQSCKTMILYEDIAIEVFKPTAYAIARPTPGKWQYHWTCNFITCLVVWKRVRENPLV